MKDDQVLPLGSFAVKSGKLIVSDPCYDRKKWCCGSVDAAANGVWYAAARLRTYHYHVEGKLADDTRVRELLAWTEPVNWKGDRIYGGGPWDQLSFVVGVDSGQAGVFDAKAYQDNRYGRKLLEEQCKAGEAHFTLEEAKRDPAVGFWYWAVCNLTLNKLHRQGGILQGGVVVCSGWGDGAYGAYCRHVHGKVVAIKVVFINPRET